MALPYPPLSSSDVATRRRSGDPWRDDCGRCGIGVGRAKSFSRIIVVCRPMASRGTALLAPPEDRQQSGGRCGHRSCKRIPRPVASAAIGLVACLTAWTRSRISLLARLSGTAVERDEGAGRRAYSLSPCLRGEGQGEGRQRAPMAEFRFPASRCTRSSQRPPLTLGRLRRPLPSPPKRRGRGQVRSRRGACDAASLTPSCPRRRAPRQVSAAVGLVACLTAWTRSRISLLAQAFRDGSGER